MGGAALDRFMDAAGETLQQVTAQTMLTPGIHAAYRDGINALSAHPQVRTIASASTDAPNACAPALFATDARSFRADPQLDLEVFGAASLIVRCQSLGEVAELIEGLEDQLTATRAGRILTNGWPTGVEVCRAMVHVGPYPATSDSRTTSVGTLAMMRFVRLVCYQNMPESLLPPSLRTG